MSSKNLFIEKQITYNTIIEINDDSKDFIRYWNLAMKEHLSNNYITLGPESNKSGVKSLNSLFIKLVDKDEFFSPEKSDIIQFDKLFIIDVYRIKKDKEFNSDFVKYYKNNHNINNFNVILYNIDEIKDNTLKNINKIYEKIKYKTGLSDFSFIPYNDQNFVKFYSIIDNVFLNLKNKITTEYNKRLQSFSETINNINDIYNSDEGKTYEYIKNKILYLDLLTMGDFWEDIKNTCYIDVYKIFDKLGKKYIFENCGSFAQIDILDIKKKVKSKTLTNVEYQIFLIYNYIRSCRYLKEYNILTNFMCNFCMNFNLYESSFKSIYHFFYWEIYFTLNFIDYLTQFREIIIQKDFDSKNSIEQGILYLYTFVSKNFKIYAKKINIELPSIKLFIFLKQCVDKDMNIKEELNKIISLDLGDIEKDENFQKFKTDIKIINENEKLKLYNIFTNKKAFIEEYLLIFQIINKRNCKFLDCKTSIRGAFEMIPLLLILNKFEDAKKILNDLLQEEKLFKRNKWTYIHQYICLIFIMLLNCLEKNKDNLKLMFKLLDTNFSNMDFFLKILETQDKNLINDIISKYIESYSEIEENKEDKLDKIFSLDKAIHIKLEKIKDNIIFINKPKTKKEQIKYKFTNNTGISVNIDKIQLIFEKVSDTNGIKEENEDNKENKEIIYEINSNSNNFKSILPFVKEQENLFEIIVDESNDVFQLNTMYKFKQIKYIIKNSLCGLYHIKEDIKIVINSIDLKIFTQVYPSYDQLEIHENQDNKKYKFYFNVLSKINVNLIDMPSQDELNNKSLKILIEHVNKKEDSKLIIHTQVLKENINKTYPEAIIENFSVEFPPFSLKDKEKLEKVIIPFYVENINFYANEAISIKITVHILDKNDNDKIIYSYNSFHNINLIHLFIMSKKFRVINNKYLMQSTFSLNIEANNIKVYTHNSTNYSFYINTTEAINLVLLLSNNQNEIIKKLRQNFLDFSIDEISKTDDGKEEKKVVNYRLCYPETNIIEEIKELNEIPYHISIDIDDSEHKIFQEMSVNIKIKKFNKKKVYILTYIHDNDNWAIIGKSKLVEEWKDENNNERNIKIKLLPLVDGFLKLPEIEFLEYEIHNKTAEKKDEKIKIDILEDSIDNKEEIVIGKMNFDPIEFGTIIQGNEKVIKIKPNTECSLKLNLT